MTDNRTRHSLQDGHSLQRWHRLRTSPRFPFVLFLGLLVAGGLFQVYCYWWGVRIQRAMIRTGGSVQRMNIYPNSLKALLPPNWLDPMEPIVAASIFNQKPMSVQEMSLLEGLPFLRSLSLGRELSFDGWLHIGNLKHLEEVQINYWNRFVLDADLERLSRLKHLNQVFFNGATIEFSGLRHLAALSHLESITMSSCSPLDDKTDHQPLSEFASSASLKQLGFAQCSGNIDRQLLAMTSSLPEGTAPLPNLRILKLNLTRITDAGLANLKYLSSLVHLDLSETKVTSEGLRQLKSLPNLKTLYLAHCSLSQKEVAVLAEMHNLESLNIESASLSEESLMQLASLPRLRRFRITYAHPSVLSKVQHRLPPGCKFVHY